MVGLTGRVVYRVLLETIAEKAASPVTRENCPLNSLTPKTAANDCDKRHRTTPRLSLP
jgi:hypothetical protein